MRDSAYWQKWQKVRTKWTRLREFASRFCVSGCVCVFTGLTSFALFFFLFLFAQYNCDALSWKASIVCRYNYKTINKEIEAIDRLLLYTLFHCTAHSRLERLASVKSLAVLAKSSSMIVVFFLFFFFFFSSFSLPLNRLSNDSSDGSDDEEKFSLFNFKI